MANKNSSVPKLRWEECCAKLILERVFPERFGTLTISDKPDLQNFTLDVGIEVTTAESKAEREMDHLFSLLTNNKGTIEQRKRNKDRIEQLGGEYDDRGILSGPAELWDNRRIYSALENKLIKLNNGTYRTFAKQYVIITDPRGIDLDEMSEVYSELNKRQEQFAIKFDSVFLYCFDGAIDEYDMQSGEYHRYRIDDIGSLADEARQMLKGKGN